MDINVTLVIQIINFWITYFFLGKLLWKPMVSMLDKREAAKKNLLTHLQNREHLLNQRIDEKEGLLKDFKLYLKKHYRVKRPKEIPVPSGITYKRNKDDIMRMEKQTEKL